MKKYINSIKSDSSFFKNVAKVASGTALAQFVGICFIPFLSRIYSVEDFGVLGIVTAMSLICKAVFSLRYDFAIPTVHKESEAWNLLFICIFSSIFFLLIIYSILFLVEIAYFEKYKEIKFIIPLIFFFASCDNALSLWVNRKNRFGLFSSSRVLRISLIVLSQLILGYFFKIEFGLVIGLLIGEFGVACFLFVSSMRGGELPRISFAELKAAAIKNKDNPIYLLPGHALNMTVSRMPIIIIESFFGAVFAGIFYMAQTIISLPSQFIASGAFKVFLPTASRLYEQTGSFYGLAKKTVFAALIACAIIYPCVDLVTYFFIDELLGDKWINTRLTILLFSLFEILPMIFYPISGAWFITENQKLNLKYQLMRSTLIGIGLFVGVSIGGYYSTIICYGILRSLAFFLFLIKCLALSKGEQSTNQ